MDMPQIYLVTPPTFTLGAFTPLLTRVLDSAPVACLRLSLASRDEDEITRAADALREIAHARDIPLLIDGHVPLAERLGLDGVHLDGARGVRDARRALGSDAIVGAFCGASRHDGLTAGEAGADYIAFGPAAPGALGNGGAAQGDLFSWWSDMVELPVVAEGALGRAEIAELAAHVDFFALADEIWRAPDPAEALRGIAALIAESAG